METRPAYGERLRRAMLRSDKHANKFAANVTLSKAESERIRREECDIICGGSEECEQFQSICGRYHLCLDRSEGWWSDVMQRKIWTKKVWMYIPSTERADTMEFYEDEILSALQEEDGISLRELSRRTDIPISTCWKLVNRLVESGHINKDEIKIKGKNTYQLHLIKMK